MTVIVSVKICINLCNVVYLIKLQSAVVHQSQIELIILTSAMSDS